MARLFGTDGIRGVANVDLKPTLAYALGRATAHRLVGPGGSLVIGQDTRRSGDMFVAAIAAGASSLGAEVHEVGVVPTPALAFIAGSGPFAAGIMVSASHNPADDNGLKVLDGAGLKLDDAVEDELEQLIWQLGRPRRRQERRPGPDRGPPRPRRRLPSTPARPGPERPGERHAPGPRWRERFRAATLGAGDPARDRGDRSRSSTPSPTG